MTRRALSLGRVSGCVVEIHWSAAAVVASMTVVAAVVVLPASAPDTPAWAHWLAGLVAALVFVGSLLTHEFAHAVVASRHRLPVYAIRVGVLGGVVLLGEEPHDPRADLRIAAVGPLASLAFAVGAVLVAAQAIVVGAPTVVTAAAVWVGVVNAFVAVFNMLPAEPLDGGRIVRAVVWRLVGERSTADRVASWIGRGFGAALVLVGGAALLGWRQWAGGWLVLLGGFLCWAAVVGSRHRGEAVRPRLSRHRARGVGEVTSRSG